VLGGHGRGLRAAGIDDDELAAARGSAFSRRGMPGAVIRLPFEAIGLAPEHQEILGAVDVGDRQQELVPVHARAHELVRPLVHRRRAEQVRRSQAPSAGRQVGDVAEVVHVGIAEVGGDRGRAMRLLDRASFVPASAKASSQPIGRQWSPSRRIGVCSRSGSASRSRIALPLGRCGPG
jgi:hypothetical protein